MTISQALVEQISEQPPHPNNRVKYLHLRKSILLTETGRNLSLDETTFNGKNHLTIKFTHSTEENVSERLRRINFDAITVAYKENKAGDLDIAIVFKSPKDDYVKKIGNSLANNALEKYLEVDDKVYMWHYSPEEISHAFVLTLSLHSIAWHENIFPHHLLKNATVSDVRNSLVTQKVKEAVFELLETYVALNAIWLPRLS